MFGVVTQIGHRFVLYALSPLIYNIGIILGIVVLYPVLGLPGLAYGVVFGALGHMFVQMPLVRSSSLSFWITTKIDWSLMLEILKVSVPRALTLAMHQVVLIVLVGIASLMAVGSVAVFQFAFNLQSVPLAIIGASYSIAAFPLLADLYTQKKMDAFRIHIASALRHIIFWSVPAIGLIVVLRAQMVRVVLGSGAFDWGDTRLTAAVLALLSLSLVAQAVNLLLVRVFYAGGLTKIPFFVTMFGSATAVALTYVFYKTYVASAGIQLIVEDTMRIGGVPGSEVLTIALAYSTALVVQMIVLMIFAVRTFQLSTDWLPLHLFRSISAAVVGGFCAYVSLNFFIFGINEETFIGIFLQGLMGGIAGIIGVAATYYITKSPELREIHKSLKSRRKRVEVVGSTDEIL